MIEQLIDYLHFTSIFWQIVTPLVFMFADIITGFIQACINQNVDSQKMRIGIMHKILLILTMILSFIIDFAFGIKIVSISYCVYLVIMEAVSISENLTKSGIDLGKFKNILKIKWEGDEKNG